MKSMQAWVLIAVISATLAAVACGGVGGGPRKVVVSENVCSGARFLRLRAGETNRIVLDNTNHSPDQKSLSLKLTRFPLVVEDELPPNTIIGDPRSTVALQAPPGEVRELDVRPTLLGEYKATCGMIIGTRSIQNELPFQIVN